MRLCFCLLLNPYQDEEDTFISLGKEFLQQERRPGILLRKNRNSPCLVENRLCVSISHQGQQLARANTPAEPSFFPWRNTALVEAFLPLNPTLFPRCLLLTLRHLGMAHHGLHGISSNSAPSLLTHTSNGSLCWLGQTLGHLWMKFKDVRELFMR